MAVELKLTATGIPTEQDKTNLFEAFKLDFNGKIIMNFHVTWYAEDAIYWLVSFDVVRTSDYEAYYGVAAMASPTLALAMAPNAAPPTSTVPGTTSPRTTLVLAFSRDLDDFLEARQQAEDIEAAVAAQEETWTKYFKPKVEIYSCNNTAREDTYIPALQGQNDAAGEPVQWVEGPNRQFEKMMRRVMENIPDAVVFMKEFDTVPQMDNHYGKLLQEVQQNRPFHMLGR